MTTFQHLDQAIDDLELAALHYLSAREMAEFNVWPAWYVERIDLLKRATLNLREKMLKEISDSRQQELFFAEAPQEDTPAAEAVAEVA